MSCRHRLNGGGPSSSYIKWAALRDPDSFPQGFYGSPVVRGNLSCPRSQDSEAPRNTYQQMAPPSAGEKSPSGRKGAGRGRRQMNRRRAGRSTGRRGSDRVG